MLKKNLAIVKPRKKITFGVKKEAVKTIEEAYKSYMHREEMRIFRKYLWEIPYESRLLFIKFGKTKRERID